MRDMSKKGRSENSQIHLKEITSSFDAPEKTRSRNIIEKDQTE